MSVKMMSLVFERFPYGGNERVLALAIADHAHDDGSSVYPGNERLAQKTLISERTVIRLMQKFVKIGWLIKVKNGNSGRGIANEYCISPGWIKGDNLSPFVKDEKRVTNDAERVTNPTERVTNDAIKGDIAVSPQQELTKYNHQETSPRARETSPENQPARPEGLLACRLIKLNVAVTSINQILCKWVTDKISDDLIDQCVQLARQNKPWPEKIAAGYLDAIIRNELKPKTDNSWLMTDEGVISKGREVGIDARAGESMNDYRNRLRAALGVGMREAA
jgi:hypothetical protein